MLKLYTEKIPKFFKSVRLTVIILASLILIYFLGLILPQKWMFDSRAEYIHWAESNWLNRILDFIGFTDIYLSPLTILLLVLFFINLLVVTLNRVPVMLRRAYIMEKPRPFSASELKGRHVLKDLSPGTAMDTVTEGISSFFRKRRWYVFRHVGNSAFTAVKNRYSPIGFLLFHLSFLLLLAGGLLLAYTRFSGNLVLTEGQFFFNDIKQFRRIISDAKIMRELPSLGLFLEKVNPLYENEVPTGLGVELKVNYRGDVKREVLRVNEPIKRGPLSIIAKNIGVSPLFVVRGPSGQELDGAYVSLNVLKGQEDHFQFERDRRFKFYVRFFPDYVVENGIEKTRSIKLKNPAIYLTIEKEGEGIYEGTVRMGESADMEPFTISFEDIRYWAEFIIVREYGRMPLVAGFLFAATGLIMRLVFYQKRLRLAIEYVEDKPLLYIDGRSEYFHHSFKEEMGRLINELDNFLRKNA